MGRVRGGQTPTRASQDPKKSNTVLNGSRLGLRVILVAVVVGAVVLLPTAGSSWEGVAKPKISKFTASPKAVTAADGTVVLTGTVTAATNCTLSSSLPVGGLPVTTSCSSGSVSQTVVVPINSGTKKLTYKLSLTASGPGGTKAKKISLSVAAGAGQPMPTGFTGTYVGSDDSGGDTNGSFTITGTADPHLPAIRMVAPTTGRRSRADGRPLPVQAAARSGRRTTTPASGTPELAVAVASSLTRPAPVATRRTSISASGPSPAVLRQYQSNS